MEMEVFEEGSMGMDCVFCNPVCSLQTEQDD